jgi:hypothetical protein
MLLQPKGRWRISNAAANALAAIGDPKSLAVLEAGYAWGLEAGQEWVRGNWALDALGAYKAESLPEALRSAWRCWAHAAEKAGSEVSEHRTIEAGAADTALARIARVFTPEFVAAEQQKADPESDYRLFLDRLAAEQRKEAQ